MHRPAHWNGVELDSAPKKLSELSTKAKHHHGAVQPFIAGSMESHAGYDTYRVYLLFDEKVGMSMYASASTSPAARVAAEPPPLPPSRRAPRPPAYAALSADQRTPLPTAYGDEYSALSLSTDDGTPFFQVETPFGTDTGGVHPAMFDVKPEARYDSWLTFNQDDGENKDKIKCVTSAQPCTRLRAVGSGTLRPAAVV